MLRFQGDGKEIPVKIVWARPLSGKGKELVFIDDNKKEVAMLDSLDCLLDAASRKLAEEEVGLRYLMIKITQVYEIKVLFGNRFWDVETLLGRKRFAMKEPSKSMTRFPDNRIIVRDTLGNSYEIESLNSLDKHSQKEIEKVL